MTSRRITIRSLKMLPKSIKHKLASIYHIVRVHVTEPEIRLLAFNKEKTSLADSAQGLICQDGKTIAIYSIKPARVRIRSTTANPDRVTLYRQDSPWGICVFYYKSNVERVLVAHGDSVIPIQRDDIPAIRKAFRKFTRTARKTDFKPPGKPFTEYEAPQ